ncbi:CRE-BATH-40 protein [Aphelenchoides fujianensis]|nr:CRE-BATH-40 protein [Aphelenchoides fujianensis]
MSAAGEKLMNRLAAAFNDGTNWDFVIKCGEIEFKAGPLSSFSTHPSVQVFKFALSAQSEVFQRMFSADMREAEENRAEIKDFSPQAIECLLRFCYTTTIAPMDSPMLAEVYSAAHCYQMAELIDACKRQAMAAKSVENVFEWLVVGFGYEDEQLKHQFLEFFLQHDEEIQALPTFEVFVEENASIAVELMRRQAAERKSQKAAVQKLQKANQQLNAANERPSNSVVRPAVRPAPPRQVVNQALYFVDTSDDTDE